ncbi:MAG: caspase family protein [Chitinophagales bacterium]|nr:caspase family protein [Chitinophagales bacterium]
MIKISHLLQSRLFVCCLLAFPYLANAQRGAAVINLKNQTDSTQSLVIGISKYKEESLQLKYAQNDAELFSSFLQDAGWSNHVKLLADSDATASNIYKAIKQLIVSADSTQPVFIYFAGHGDKMVESDLVGEAYLLAWDANNNRVYDGVGGTIEFSKLENYIQKLAKSRKANVYLILDACHSGFDPYKEGMLGAYEEAGNKFSSANKLLSCSGNELAYENDQLKHGVFTYYLVQGMKGYADNPADNNITVSELEAYLKSAVQKETQNKQTPVITKAGNNELLGSLTPELKAHLMRQEPKTVSGEILAMGRSTDGTSAKQTYTADAATMQWVEKFNEAFAKRNFFGTDTGCAFIIRQLTNQKNAAAFIIEQMKDVLASELITQSQLAVNEILKGKDNPPKVDFIENARMSSDSALLFLDEEDIRYQTAYINSRYLQVYSCIRRRDFKNYDYAMAICNSLLQIEKRAAYIYLAKAQLHDYRDEWDSALYYASYASRLVPTWTYPYNLMGNVYQDKGDFANGMKCFAKALSLDTTFSRSYNNVANLYFDNEMYIQAEADYFKSLSLKNDSIEMSIPFSNLSLLYKNRGNEVKAEEYAKLSIKAGNYYNGWIRLASLTAQSADKEKHLLKAVEAEPHQPEPYTELADYYRSSKANRTTADYKVADSLYNIAIALNPYYNRSYFGKAYLWLYQYEQPEKADSIIRECAVLNGKKPQYFNRLAWYYINRDSTHLALQQFHKAIEIDSAYATPYVNLYEQLYKNVSRDSAFTMLRLAMQRIPHNPKWYYMKANHLYGTGQYDSAIFYYNKCLSYDSLYAAAYASLGVCYMETGNAQRAISYIEKGVKADPYKNKRGSFLRYAVHQSKSISDWKERKLFLLQYLLLDSNSLLLWKAILESAYHLKKPDKFSVAQVEKAMSASPISKREKSAMAYQLCLIAIELKDKPSLSRYYKVYQENTRNTDVYLDIVVDYLFRNRKIDELRYSDFSKYKPAGYETRFNKYISKIRGK